MDIIRVSVATQADDLLCMWNLRLSDASVCELPLEIIRRSRLS